MPEQDTPESPQTFDGDEILLIGSKQISNLFLPVSLCMFLTIVVAKTIPFYQSTQFYLTYTPFHTENADVATLTWQTIANVGIILGVVILMTFILLILFKYECYKIIQGWLIFTTLFLLFIISTFFCFHLIRQFGIFFDYITFALIVWNVGVVGVMSVNWKSPLIVQQGYLIFISLLMALIFLKYMPKWTTWLLLGAICIWDLIAVLCPKGPLKMLVELSSERQQPLMPAMIYSTTAVWLVTMASDRPKKNSDSTQLVSDTEEEEREPGVVFKIPRNRRPPSRNPSANENPEANPDSGNVDWRAVQEEARKREDHGVMLGLGDFIFYSLLIGRATLDSDGVTVVACYVSILIGMTATIIILGVTRKALPALPISVLCALFFYFLTSIIMTNFVKDLFDARIII